MIRGRTGPRRLVPKMQATAPSATSGDQAQRHVAQHNQTNIKPLHVELPRIPPALSPAVTRALLKVLRSAGGDLSRESVGPAEHDESMTRQQSGATSP